MIGHLPYVFAFVLIAAFLLLLVTFRSIVDPDQGDPAQPAVRRRRLRRAGAGVPERAGPRACSGFEANGAITAWLPLFLFVILFGLSMDYHVFILSRIREAFDRGMKTEDAVAQGIKSTAGVVTSAAIVMVAVFSMFALLSSCQMKQMGIGLAAAVLIDATIIRGVLLPATMKLLGDRNWWLPAARLAAQDRPRAGGAACRRIAHRRHSGTDRRPPSGGRRPFQGRFGSRFRAAAR